MALASQCEQPAQATMDGQSRSHGLADDGQASPASVEHTATRERIIAERNKLVSDLLLERR
eukprot:7426606-Lingulodinium_polyedra.AAC.1